MAQLALAKSCLQSVGRLDPVKVIAAMGKFTEATHTGLHLEHIQRRS